MTAVQYSPNMLWKQWSLPTNYAAVVPGSLGSNNYTEINNGHSGFSGPLRSTASRGTFAQVIQCQPIWPKACRVLRSPKGGERTLG